MGYEEKQGLAHIWRAQAAIDFIAIQTFKRVLTARKRHAARVALRVLGAVGGGYALSAALVALLSAALPLAGLTRSEAVVLAATGGFGIYLLLLLWAFSVRSLARLWAVLAIGTALCAAVAASV